MVADFEQILKYAVEKEASDIHLTPGLPVSFRIHGKIEYVGEPLDDAYTQNLAINALTPKQQAQLDEFRDVDFSVSSREQFRFRGNAFFAQGGLSFVLRLIPKVIPDFAELGFDEVLMDHFMNLKQGLVLVVGPTGHGKSTTLAAMIQARSNTHSEHIITMEDPVEFMFKSGKSIVHQRDVGKDAASFERGLKAALREDPDVLLVGEMRDLETISAALTAAETGHLVLSTLHTHDTPETINRIIDAFPTAQQGQIRSQLASSLKMVVAQRLLPSVDGKRSLVYEVMTSNYAIKNHIRQGSLHQIQNYMQTDTSGTMNLFDQSLVTRMLEGEVGMETAFEHCRSREQLIHLLELNNVVIPDQFLDAGSEE